MSATQATEHSSTAVAEPQIVVHHLENSRSQRILWLLEELEIPYEIKKYKRVDTYFAPPELKKIHALGKSPIITDGHVTVAESGAIVDYIIAKYGARLNPTSAGYVDNLFFAHYAEGSLMPILVNSMVFRIIPSKSPFFIRPFARLICSGVDKNMVEPQLRIHCDFITAHLEKTQTGWFANGDHPTSADFQMYFVLEALIVRLTDHGPAVEQYIKKVRDRPAYKRALDRGGKFEVIQPPTD